jgi:CheY-like chemotaxis protein
MHGVVKRAREALQVLMSSARQDDAPAVECAVGAALSRVGDMLVRVLPKTIALHIDVPEGLPRMQADESRLEAALLNLASNAQFAMPEGGTLTISARSELLRQGGTAANSASDALFVRIDVSDTGIGMSAATLARASEPFFTTRPAGHGTGLGLSTTRAFAEQSGGRFAIASTPGRGTTVSLWLPSRAEPAGLPEDPDMAAAHTIRIVLLDDEAMIRDVMSRQLRKRGLLVDACENGAQALGILAGPQPVDLLLTDFAMPDVPCEEFITRAHELRPGLPVIILTGFPMDAAAVVKRYTGTGLISLLCKPAPAGMIEAEIRKIVQQGTTARS